MSSDKVYEALREIALVPGKLDKESLVRIHIDKTPDFKRTIIAILDPMTTYGIAKVPQRTEEGFGEFNTMTWNMLDALAQRGLTGNAARDAVQAEVNRMSEGSAELLRLILTKQTGAGFSSSTVNLAVPGTIITFDCMLAHKFDGSRVKVWPQVAEPKLDGVRVLAFIDLTEQTVKFFSRSGKEFDTFDHLKTPILAQAEQYRGILMGNACDEYDSLGLPDGEETNTSVLDELYAKHGVDDALELVLDGEIVSGSFNKTVGDVRRKSEQASDAVFNVFDLLPASVFATEDKKGSEDAGTYTERRKRLEQFLLTAPSNLLTSLPRYFVNSEAEIHTLYQNVRARGLEGLIIKDPKGLYHRRRNHAWMKIKAEESVDVEIVGAEEGTEKYTGMLGALVVDYKGVKVNVGSGLTDQQRKDFWAAFKRDSREYGPSDYELLGRLIEVEYHEVTPDGSLRHPRFVRFRDDKPIEEAA